MPSFDTLPPTAPYALRTGPSRASEIDARMTLGDGGLEVAVLSYDAWVDRDCAVLMPYGDADAYAVPMLRRALGEAIAMAKRPDLVVICDSIEYIDSTGVGVLLSVFKRLRSRGGAIALCGVSEQLSQTLRITGLAKTLPEFPTVEEALDWLEQRTGPMRRR
jgi:anti-sigma B factor antagonist